MIRFVNGVPVEMTGEDELRHEQLASLTPEQRIEELKQRLSETDYKTLKFVEGALTEQEFSEACAERAEMRRLINELEEE